MARDVINPDALSNAPQVGYSHAVVEDGTLYVSGQVARNAEGDVVGDDIETQARQAFENVEVILEEVDRTYEDVAKVTTYLVDLAEHSRGYHSVWMDVFEEPYPAHTMLGVDQLASPELLVEIEVELPLS
jgi:enamine deaminase RidA (YjgF/YER057c/UK114 family)